jgi:hypothetical protein
MNCVNRGMNSSKGVIQDKPPALHFPTAALLYLLQRLLYE